MSRASTPTPSRRLIVACSGGCGRKQDLTREHRIGKSVGIKRTPKWICAECYRREEKKL